jgi:hypothetical protein
MPRENEKRSKSHMAEADPLCHCVSAICFFGSRGPRRLQRRFPVFAGPIWPCVISPSHAVKTLSVPRRPSRSWVLRRAPGSGLVQWGPLCLSLLSAYGIPRRPRLPAMVNLTVASQRFNAEFAAGRQRRPARGTACLRPASARHRRHGIGALSEERIRAPGIWRA